MNFLEQLAAEWYEYTGKFVMTNLRTRKRPRGGWDVELDVLAFNPKNGELIHLEASGDANSWTERKRRFQKKKFILTKAEYGKIVGVPVQSIRKIALVGWTKSTNTNLNWGSGIEVKLIPDFVREIISDLRKINRIKTNLIREAVPEGFPLLRAIQITLTFDDTKKAQ
jgi:hypothetical protein